MSSSFPKTVQKFFARVRLLTLLILVASVSFMIRVGDAVTDMRSLSGSAYAEEKKAEPPPSDKEAPKVAKDTAQQPPSEDLKSPEDAKKEAEAPKEGDKAAEKGDITLPSTEPTGKKWEDATDTDTEYPQIKKEMYEDLLKRRQELDDREKQLSQREALVDASQKEIDHKYKELVGLRDEIQALLKKQGEAEDARIQSLIKIYTGMKPKDAARIFNTLDMDILIAVVSKMPENKAAPIIANMDADPARALTTMLAEQRKLPSLPQ